jgi:hypothetical protein
MVEDIRMGPPDPRGNGLEGHRLWPSLDQQRARGVKGGTAAGFWGKAFWLY